MSGHTLTSPNVYHFLRDVGIKTVDGTLSKVGETSPTTVWHTTAFATASPLTVAQQEAEILRQTVRCGGSGSKKHCVFYYLNDFNAANLKTVRAADAEKGKGNGIIEGTIIQQQYVPTIGIPFEEVRKQNGDVKFANDCDWTSYYDGWKATAGPKAFVTAVRNADFHEIGSTSQEARPTGV